MTCAATVFYTVYGSPEQQADTAAALESATGIIRSEVGRQTGLRHTPSLTFVADDVPDNVRHIEELVEVARRADEDLARIREGAVPAGDPDPYRASRPATRTDGGRPGRRAGPGGPGGPGGVVVVDKPGGLTSMTSSRAFAGGWRPVGSGTPARSIRWRPACSWSWA